MYDQTVKISLALHLLFLISVFDIYFRSPVIKPLEPVTNNLETKARRLVLFVADGLRADYFFTVSGNGSLSPFLRNIIKTEGAWGVSHTQVPTESRPGHIALIAGMYEDPSAVFKGWKENTVDFDSVFNQSFATFAFGSPDILPIFSKGNLKNNIYNYMYSADLQDFSGSSGQAAKLNYWVLDEFHRFLDSSRSNESIKSALQQNKLVFFFHLLGTDVAGHSNKPGSKEYAEAIISADKCVQEISELVNLYYKDKKTAFVYTSDHGMTDWGSHGDGSPSETEIPIVVWGAGLRGPLQGKNKSPEDWDLNDFRRIDISQADTAPLMSILVGIPIPVNSVGELPYDFLQHDSTFIIDALSLNWNQLSRQYHKCLQNVKNNLFYMFYYPYDSANRKETLLMESFQCLRSVNASVEAAKNLISFYLGGINYYINYFCEVLKVFVSIIYILWIVNLFLVFLISIKFQKVETMQNFVKSIDPTITPYLYLIGFIISVIFCAQNLEWSFYVYLCVMLYLCKCIFENSTLLWRFGLKHDFQRSPLILWNIGLTFVGHATIICCLMYSFFERSLLAVLMIFLALWPLVYHFKIVWGHKIFIFQWCFSCFCLAAFPLAPTIGSYYNIYFAYIAAAVCLLVSFHKIKTTKEKHYIAPVYNFMAVLYGIALADLVMIDISFLNNYGLSPLNQFVSWSLLIVSILFVSMGYMSSSNVENVLSVSGFLNIPFLLLSLAHEAVFPLMFTYLLTMWVKLEGRILDTYPNILDQEPSNSRSLSPSALLRISLFYLTFTILSFFSIGNVASLNSFDPTWTRSFLTVFSPFTMMSLIIFKSVIPMYMVSTALHVILKKCCIPFEPIIISIIMFSDIIGLHFFFRVTNKGSWLTIGMSISHFVLIEAIILVILLMHWIIKVIMSRPHFLYTKRSVRYFMSCDYTIHSD